MKEAIGFLSAKPPHVYMVMKIPYLIKVQLVHVTFIDW